MHESAPNCKYMEGCSKKLCPYKHSDFAQSFEEEKNPAENMTSHSEVTKNTDTQESIQKDENEKESIENGIGIGHRDSVRTFDCENCDFKSESYNIYFEHINLAHEYGDDFEVKQKSF